ncbi:MAG: GNAT family N-acetyltransferase [Oricola sp.]
MTANPPLCRRVAARDDLAACFAIRQVVFVEEQQVAPEIDRDGLDDACIHYMAEIAGKPVATARVQMQPGRIKIQRVAVLREARGKRVGEALMRFLMDDLAASDEATGREFFLSSQAQAIPFYERLGFTVCSDEYPDAGIPHRDMRAEIAR